MASTSAFRIPLDLQAVFVASNQGEDVHQTPASKSAVKVFRYFLGGTWTGLTGGRRKPTSKRSRRLVNISETSGRTVDTEVSAANSTVAPTTKSAPPSVVAAPKPKPAPKSKGTAQKPAAAAAPQPTPQQWAISTLAARGYNTTPTRTLDTAYHTPATKLQLASYNAATVQLATKTLPGDDMTELRDMLSCGMSANACNVYGETLMHKACRLGHAHVLATFVEFGAEVRACDEQGRTLLHDACWSARPAFRTFALLTKLDPGMLFLADTRGFCPFDYIRKDDHSLWVTFLERNVNAFWPAVEQPQQYGTPGSRPIMDPVNALTVQLAEMVAEGRLSPREALKCMEEQYDNGADGDEYASDEDASASEDEEGSEYTSEYDDEDGSYSSSWESSNSSVDDMHLLQELGVMH